MFCLFFIISFRLISAVATTLGTVVLSLPSRKFYIQCKEQNQLSKSYIVGFHNLYFDQTKSGGKECKHTGIKIALFKWEEHETPYYILPPSSWHVFSPKIERSYGRPRVCLKPSLACHPAKLSGCCSPRNVPNYLRNRLFLRMSIRFSPDFRSLIFVDIGNFRFAL